MTLATCKKMLEHFQAKEDTKMVAFWQERVQRKEARLGIKDVDDSTESDTSFSHKTKEELKALCDEAGLSYTTKSTKDDLVVLLEQHSEG